MEISNLSFTGYSVEKINVKNIIYKSRDNATGKVGAFKKAGFPNGDTVLVKKFKRTDVIFEKIKKNFFAQDSILSRMKLSNYDKNRKLVMIDAKKADELFSKSDFYISVDSRESGLSGVVKYIKTGKKIDAPAIVLREENNAPVLNFLDGRHRFRVFRNSGMKKVSVAMDDDSVKVAEKYGLIAD